MRSNLFKNKWFILQKSNENASDSSVSAKTIIYVNKFNDYTKYISVNVIDSLQFLCFLDRAQNRLNLTQMKWYN